MWLEKFCIVFPCIVKGREWEDIKGMLGKMWLCVSFLMLILILDIWQNILTLVLSSPILRHLPYLIHGKYNLTSVSWVTEGYSVFENHLKWYDLEELIICALHLVSLTLLPVGQFANRNVYNSLMCYGFVRGTFLQVISLEWVIQCEGNVD